MEKSEVDQNCHYSQQRICNLYGNEYPEIMETASTFVLPNQFVVWVAQKKKKLLHALGLT